MQIVRRNFIFMVAILVIVLLYNILPGFFPNIQKDVRDIKRKADIDEVAKALEVNYGNILCSEVSVDAPYCGLNASAYIMLAHGLPKNPQPGGAYYYNDREKVPGPDFMICALLETRTGNNNKSDGSSPVINNKGQYYCKKNRQD